MSLRTSLEYVTRPIACIGNTYIDRVWHADLGYGQKYQASPRLSVGGFCFNFGRQTAALGMQTVALSAIGNDANARGVVRAFRNSQIETHGVQLQDAPSRVSNIVVNGNDRTVFRGAAETSATWDLASADEKLLARCAAWAVGGSIGEPKSDAAPSRANMMLQAIDC